MRAIRDIVRALNISHARMEQGNMRADVNVSLRRKPTDPFGTRSETKNVNTFRGIEKTLQYEIRRQAAILSEGGEILQETLQVGLTSGRIAKLHIPGNLPSSPSNTYGNVLIRSSTVSSCPMPAPASR